MHIVTGDLWDELGKADLLLVTTNGVVVGDQLVMGAGAAKEAKLRVPQLPSVLAVQARKRTGPGYQHPYLYGVLPGVLVGKTWVGAFQTKLHCKGWSSRDIIWRSTQKLTELAPKFIRIAMNYPGIGLGGLETEAVIPLIWNLPKNVYIYQRGAR
jgi:hypothetical protein